jgi:hypothetical protein
MVAMLCMDQDPVNCGGELAGIVIEAGAIEHLQSVSG